MQVGFSYTEYFYLPLPFYFPLCKRGIKGDFFSLTNPLSPPLEKGGFTLLNATWYQWAAQMSLVSLLVCLRQNRLAPHVPHDK